MPQHAIEVEQHGQLLRGTAYRPGAGRYPTAVFLHGFTGNRIESGFLFVRLARALMERGIAGVTFDFRGSGESDGHFSQMLPSAELDDAVRMVQWAQGQVFADRSRVALLGFSLGGLLAACASARFADLRALVLLAPTTTHNLCRYAGDRDACTPEGAVAVGPHRLHADFFADLRRLSPLSDVARHRRPTLLVQGTADTAVPPEVSQEYTDAMRQYKVPVEVEMIEGADHAFAKQPQFQERLIEVVAGWLARELIGSGQPRRVAGRV